MLIDVYIPIRFKIGFIVIQKGDNQIMNIQNNIIKYNLKNVLFFSGTACI